jgi:HK97 family phage portal protein
VVKKLQKAPPKRNEEDGPKAPAYAWTTVIGRNAIKYSDAMSAADALKHPVVFRIVHAIATTVASVNWYAVQKKGGSGNSGSKQQVADINDLLASPNDLMNANQLKYWLALNMALYHKVFVKIGTGISNKPNGIYPLETKYVSYELNKLGGIERFLYGTKGKEQAFATRKKAEDGKGWVSSIYVPSIEGNFAVSGCDFSHSPLKTVGGPAAVIRNLLDRAVTTSAGAPNIKYLVTTEKSITQKQSDALKDHMSGANEDDDSQVLFIRNTKVDVHKLDSGMSDIHSKIPLDDMTRMIAGAFGYPVALLGLGAADAAKYASNYSESKRSLYEETVIPNYLIPIADGMNEALSPQGVEIRFDLDSISALAEHRMKFAKDLQAVTFLDDDEKREVMGFQPRAKTQDNE